MGVHARQGAAGESDLVGFQAVTPANQPAQLLLDGRIGWIGLKGPLHMPDGGIQVPLVLADNGHADVGYEIIGDGRQDPLEDVRRVPVALGLQIGLAQQAVGIQVLGIGLKDVAAMRDGFVELFALNELVDILNVAAKRDLSHRPGFLFTV